MSSTGLVGRGTGAGTVHALRTLVAQLPFPAWLLDADGRGHGNAEARELVPADDGSASGDIDLLAVWRHADGTRIEPGESPFRRALEGGRRVETTLRPANGSAALRVAVIPLERGILGDAEGEGEEPLPAALVVAERAGPAALVDWLADVGHALRSPLSPIRTAAQLLRNPRIDAAQRDSLLEIVERQIRELMVRIDELADLVRVKRDVVHAEQRPCDLSMLLDIVRGRVSARFEEEERCLLLPSPAAELAVLVDQSQVVQALALVLGHAMRHTPPGGTVQCELLELPGSVTVRIADLDHRASPGRAESLLGPPVDRHGAGLGAGLYLAKAFIERSGGAFAARPRADGSGMEFDLTLPVAVAAP